MANRSTRLFLGSRVPTKKTKHVELAFESVETKSNLKKKIPKIITIDSITKYEVERIHKYALFYFDNQESDIPFKKMELEKLKQRNIDSLSHVDQMEHIDLLNRKEKEIKIISETKSRDVYLEKVTPLLRNYRNLFENEEKKVFGMENEVSAELTKEMVNMVSIVSYFTSIEFNFNIKTKPSCVYCNYDFCDLMPDMDGILRCPECSVENDLSHCSDQYFEVDKLMSPICCDYSVENNFIKFLDKFQGKIKSTLHKSVYKKLLDDYFIKKKKDIGEVVKRRNYDFKGFKEGTSLETMIVSLKDVGLSDFYDDVYFICKKYWGWILADLEENMEKILYIYQTTHSAYRSIENKKRSSSISIPFHTLKILELVGYRYGVSDFKIPKDEKSKRELEEYWKITCSHCNSPLIYYKATKWES
jgi:hypothetical protein